MNDAEKLAQSVLHVVGTTMFSQRRGVLDMDFPKIAVFSNAGLGGRELAGAEKEMEDSMLQRVRDTLTRLEAQDIGFASDGYSWALVAQCHKPDAVEEIRTAVWNRF